MSLNEERNLQVITNTENMKFSIILIFGQCVILILFVAFAEYAPEADASNPRNSIGPAYGGFNENTNVLRVYYPTFQDLHVMVFIGFGFIMTFMKKYSFSSIGINFLLGSWVLQWTILCQGFYQLNENFKIEIGIQSLYIAEMSSATTLISLGVVLGRVSYIQVLVMTFSEVLVFEANRQLGTKFLKIVDCGGSIFIHLFGAYYGLAVSYIIHKKHPEDNITEASTTNVFSIIGTLFLWVFWPSFNSIGLNGDDQHRAVINTILALVTSCVATFAVSFMFSENRKLIIAHIQNATLAGGVAVGAVAHLMLEPYGAVLLGILAGTLSTVGFVKVTPFLVAKFNIYDTCGVNNLHGLPALLSGILSSLMAGIASETQYGVSLYNIYTERTRSSTSMDPVLSEEPVNGRDPGDQAGYQFLAVVLTLVIAITSGLLVGLVITRTAQRSECITTHFYNSTLLTEQDSSRKCSEDTEHCEVPTINI